MVKLVQGGLGILVYFPIFYENEFDGFTLAVIDVESFYNEILSPFKENYHLQVLENNEHIFGEESPHHFGVKGQWNVLQGSMDFYLFPRDEYQRSRESVVPFVILILMLAVSFLVFIGVALFMSDKLKTNLLNDSEKRFRRLIEASPISLLMLDSDSKIVLVNEPFERLFGYPRNELLGKEVDMLIPEQFKQNHHQWVKEFVSTEQLKKLNQGITVKGYGWGGRELELEIEISSFRIKDEFFGVAAVMDVAERNQRQRELYETQGKLMLQNDELEQKTLKLEQSNRELEEFSNIVAHDLKEPLRTVSTYSNMMIEDYGDSLDDMAHKHLKSMKRQCNNMAQLLRDLLHYSRLGRGELAVRETNLKNELNQVLESFASEVDKGKLVLHVENELPTMVCDHIRVPEIFRNLISNGMKYNDNEVVEIKIGYEEFKSQHTHENGYVFYVEDNGIGIPEILGLRSFKYLKDYIKKGSMEEVQARD